MKVWRIVAVSVLCLVLAGSTACGLFGGNGEEAAGYQLGEVVRGDLTVSISGGGNMEVSNEVELTFGTGGKVDKIYVKEGDIVEEGQVLAELDNVTLTSLERAVAQARVNLRNAQESLEEVKNPYSESEIAQAELAVTNAEVALQTAQENLEESQNPDTESDIIQAELAVANAKVALQTAQENLEETQNPYTEDDIADAEAAVERAQQQLLDVQAQAPFDIADAEYAAYRAHVTYLDKRNRDLFPKEIEKAKQDWERAKLNIEMVKQNVAKAVTDAEDNLAEDEETLAEMKESPDPLDIEQKQKQLVVAQSNLVESKETLAEMKESTDPLDIEQKQKLLAVAYANLVEAEETLAEMKESADPLEVELKQLEVASAQAALDEAMERLESATMVAPFSGIVVSVNVEADQTVNENTVVSELVDPTALELPVQVDEIDIPKIKLNQRAIVSIDALPGVKLEGSVTAISPLPATTGGVILYDVTIVLTVPEGTDLKIGMSATADIMIEERGNVLLVPTQAIKQDKQGNSIVIVQAGEELQPRLVVTGLSDGLWTEIIDGLSEGEPVVIEMGTEAQLPPEPSGRPGVIPGMPMQPGVRHGR